MIARDPYAPRLDWINGGSLSWGEYRRHIRGGLRGWSCWVNDRYTDADVRAVDHAHMLAAGKAHVYLNVYYQGRAI